MNTWVRLCPGIGQGGARARTRVGGVAPGASSQNPLACCQELVVCAALWSRQEPAQRTKSWHKGCMTGSNSVARTVSMSAKVSSSARASGEMADALASGASKGNLVGVQVPPRPPTNQPTNVMSRDIGNL
jgi:hypothetical protein